MQRLRPLTHRVIACAGIGLGVFLAGFILFAAHLERHEPARVARADAIVALTGGADRIQDALHRLAQGSGDRLLISGVSPATSREAILQHLNRFDKWLACCIDLDRQAQNTVGNAEEVRRWAEQRRYRSLVVVTSSYHMPRALLELQRHMPGTTLIPSPVVTDRMRGFQMATDLGLMRTLAQEYTKFVVAYARSCLTAPTPMSEIVSKRTAGPA